MLPVRGILPILPARETFPVAPRTGDSFVACDDQDRYPGWSERFVSARPADRVIFKQAAEEFGACGMLSSFACSAKSRGC